MEMSAFSAAGYNTSKYAHPDTLNGNDVFFNQFDEIELPAIGDMHAAQETTAAGASFFAFISHIARS